jgi:hypothetical protein
MKLNGKPLPVFPSHRHCGWRDAARLSKVEKMNRPPEFPVVMTCRADYHKRNPEGERIMKRLLAAAVSVAMAFPAGSVIAQQQTPPQRPVVVAQAEGGAGAGAATGAAVGGIAAGAIVAAVVVVAAAVAASGESDNPLPLVTTTTTTQ